MPAQTFPKQRVSRSETFLRFSVVFPHSEVRKVQELRKPTAVLARDGEGEKSALWLCLNLGWTLWLALWWICFPPVGSLVSREFFGVTQWIFFWLLWAQWNPWRSHAEFFSYFCRVWVVAWSPPGLLGLRWVCLGSHVGVCPGWVFTGPITLCLRSYLYYSLVTVAYKVEAICFLLLENSIWHIL